MSELMLLDQGIYTVSEAAELVGASEALVRVWIDGHKGKQEAVIDNDLGRVGGRLAFSFINLMELRFVAFFTQSGVGIREVRRIMDEVRHTLNHPHPFATRTVFRTDGKRIVAQIAKRNGVENIYDLRSKNYEFGEMIMDSLKDGVVYDPSGDVASWHPRYKLAPNVIVHPKFAFGRPILKKEHIPTRALAQAVKAEGDVSTVAILFDVPRKLVLEAVSFEANLRKAA